ncbi:DUF1194 domain-containing protein [Celeribacter arenosi]|uniref:DUF1194 domain-containing protein n=1 Tax=Celeribacter arenosi TaxID=792649 RepID=A0ABP7KB52_9RHOB
MVRRLICRALLGLAALAPLPSVAAEQCRQALALGLDVSGSVDADEWSLQIEGIARALETEPVRRAFLAMEGALVYLMIYEWAGDAAQRDLVDWRAIRNEGDLDGVAATLRDVPRRPHAPGTAMGAGMAYGGEKLALVKGCWRYTLDISADGRSNLGPRPHTVKLSPTLAHVTINGLVVSTGSPRISEASRMKELDMLEQYFRGAVIQGHGAFVETARSYADYEAAMTRKLLKELQTLTVGDRGMDTAATSHQ